MGPIDVVAITLFTVFWLGFERMLPLFTGGRGGIVRDMLSVRAAWMHALLRREVKLMDSQFLGHTLNSASFFGTANLIIITAAAGLLFGGDSAYRSVSQLALTSPGSHLLFELKVALVVVTLARGLLDFIWGIRQLNYCLAAIGAVPDDLAPERRERWAEALSAILNPALRSFSRGVRAYYFALAAAAWMFGAVPFLVATLGSVVLLVWRQAGSGSARGVRMVHDIVKEDLVNEAVKLRSGGTEKPPFR